MSSDGGGLMLREVDRRIGLTERLARCFVDYRNPSSVEHDVRNVARFPSSGLNRHPEEDWGVHHTA